jgi:hypothetical protein
MKKILVLLLLVCQSCTDRACQRFKRKSENSSRQYEVKLYAGDSLVHQDKFRGVINQQDGGFYYYKGDTLIECQGTAVIKSIE